MLRIWLFAFGIWLKCGKIKSNEDHLKITVPCIPLVFAKSQLLKAVRYISNNLFRVLSSQQRLNRELGTVNRKL